MLMQMELVRDLKVPLGPQMILICRAVRHGRRKADTKDADETGEARSTAPLAGRRGER